MPNFRDPIQMTDENGVKRTVVNTDGTISASAPAGTAQMLQAGTDTVQRTWTAKQIHDEIARQIAAIG